MSKLARWLWVCAAIGFPGLAVAATDTWTGATNNQWSVLGNWTGQVPVDGDSLVFPAGAASFAPQNNIPGLALDSISISGAVYSLSGDANSPVTLQNLGAGAGSNGSTLGLPLVLDPSTGLTANIASGTTLTFNDKFTGGGPLTLRGGGTLAVSSSTSMSFASNKLIEAGTLDLKNFRVHTSGSLTVGDGLGAAGSAVYDAMENNQVDSLGSATVVVKSDGKLKLHTENLASLSMTDGILEVAGTAGQVTPGSLTMSGGSVSLSSSKLMLSNTVSISSSAQTGTASITGFEVDLVTNPVTVDVVDGPSVVDAQVTTDIFAVSGQSGVLRKTGAGTLTLTDTTPSKSVRASEGLLVLSGRAYNGVLDGGTLQIDGEVGSVGGGGTLTMSSGLLCGTGSVALLFSSGGTVDPGVNGPGILTVIRGGFSSNLTFNVQLNGTTAGTGYDQLLRPSANGIDLDLNNAQLTGTVGFVPRTGQAFTIISAPGNKVLQTFAGLAEGATVTLGERNFSISYTPPDNHSVVLTKLVPEIVVDDAAVAEGSTGSPSLSVTVHMLSKGALPASVDWTTVDGTATVLDGDYQPVSGTVSFDPGETTLTILVPIGADTRFEPDETFSIQLSSPQNSTLSRSLATMTILNDDAPTPTATPTVTPSVTQTPTPTVTASSTPANSVTPTPDASASATPTPDASASVTPTPDASASVTPTPDASASVTPTAPVNQVDSGRGALSPFLAAALLSLVVTTSRRRRDLTPARSRRG